MVSCAGCLLYAIAVLVMHGSGGVGVTVGAKRSIRAEIGHSVELFCSQSMLNLSKETVVELQIKKDGSLAYRYTDASQTKENPGKFWLFWSTHVRSESQKGANSSEDRSELTVRVVIPSVRGADTGTITCTIHYLSGTQKKFKMIQLAQLIVKEHVEDIGLTLAPARLWEYETYLGLYYFLGIMLILILLLIVAADVYVLMSPDAFIRKYIDKEYNGKKKYNSDISSSTSQIS